MRVRLGGVNYTILEIIGEGQSSTVYLAVNEDDVPFAIKFIAASYYQNQERRHRRLREEIRILELTAEDCGICNMHYATEREEGIFIVFDYHDGDLCSLLEEEECFSEEYVAKCALTVVHGIESLHRKNIIYRDLKLENLLYCDDDSSVILTDFGMSKIIDGDRTASFCGTPEYQAPEMIAGGDYGFEVDYWQLGVLIYEMLTGHYPFDCENLHALYQSILKDNFCFPDSMSPEAKSLIKKLTKKDPSERWCDPELIIKHPFFLRCK